MADTKRLKSTLATLLADNTSGDISAQDVRDVLESFDLSRGACFWTGYAATTMTLQGSGGPGGTNYYRLQGTTTTKVVNRFTHASPGRLTYTGPVQIKADFFAVVSFTIAGGIGNNNIGFEFAINGTAQAPGYQLIEATLAGGPRCIALLSEATLAPLDYVEIHVANETAAGMTLTPAAGVFQIQEMPLF